MDGSLPLAITFLHDGTKSLTLAEDGMTVRTSHLSAVAEKCPNLGSTYRVTIPGGDAASHSRFRGYFG